MNVVRLMIVAGLLAIVIGSVAAVQCASAITDVVSANVDTIPSYIDDVRVLSLEEVYSITTYVLSGDKFATVELVDGTECYCDQRVAHDLRLTLNHDANDKFEVWTNNDGEYEIVYKR